jgi:hypothetical protein
MAVRSGDLRILAAAAVASPDMASASVEPAGTITGSMGSKVWGCDGALDAQPLGARSYPPDPVAHRVRGYAEVGADAAMALAKGAGQQRSSVDVDRVGTMRGRQHGQQHVSHPAAGAADPSRS